MRKKIWIGSLGVLMAGGMLLLLAGCSGSGDSGTTHYGYAGAVPGKCTSCD